jgi:hypothetical protein
MSTNPAAATTAATLTDRSSARQLIMTAIPARVRRGNLERSGLDYVPYARATWEWWCRQHDVQFVVLDRPVEDEALADTPPQLQRWRAAEQLLKAGTPGSQVAILDADTMIRWDTPDFFDLADGSLAAVRDREPDWIFRSIAAYQPFFPDVPLTWWEYFNSGLVVVSAAQVELLTTTVQFYQDNRAELEVVQRESDVGVDQTLLNFIVTRSDHTVRFLPAPFNLTQCLPIPLFPLLEVETAPPGPRRERLLSRLMKVPGAFDFTRHSYVWHFNNTVRIRADLMRETWRRVRENYPGAVELD